MSDAHVADTASFGRRTLTCIKVAYLIGFFALLSGVFYPFVSGGSLAEVIAGVLVLFMGLLGGLAVYRSTSSKSPKPLFVTGFLIIVTSFTLILVMSGVI